MRCIFLAMFALLCFTYAMCYEPEPDGYTRPEVNALNLLVEQSVREPNPGASRRDIADLFGREGVK